VLDDLAKRLAKPIGDLPSNFMLDSATYERGNELGFDGIDFYVCGRAGTLGDVDAGVVSAAMVFFNPSMIRRRWERGCQVMPPRQAAEEFATCLHNWSSYHLEADLDYEMVADLLGRLIGAASPTGAPLFAAWLTLTEPPDPAQLVMHRLNALRELRGAMHSNAVLAAGLDPLIALLIKTPFMAGIFGWEEPYPDVELARDAWQEAEVATNRAMGRVLKVLDKTEQDRLAEALEQIHSGVH
jgi:hypothetical protein